MERGVRLAYDDLQGEGGLCRLRDCWYLVINRRLAAESRVRLIHQALERVPQRTPQPAPAPTVGPDSIPAEVRAAREADGRS